MRLASYFEKIGENKRLLRLWWLRQLYAWHWITAAVSLSGMLLFAATGITLNHAAAIPAKPVVQQKSGELPASLLNMLKRTPADPASPLPRAVAEGVKQAVDLDVGGRSAEWSDDEVYVALPRPGGDAWVSIDRASGTVTAETTRRGWIAYLNDLHKGRNTGLAWSWFIDIFAVACVLFTLTGLLLLQMHANRRRLTWPLVGFGVLAPVIILVLLAIH